MRRLLLAFCIVLGSGATAMATEMQPRVLVEDADWSYDINSFGLTYYTWDKSEKSWQKPFTYSLMFQQTHDGSKLDNSGTTFGVALGYSFLYNWDFSIRPILSTQMTFELERIKSNDAGQYLSSSLGMRTVEGFAYMGQSGLVVETALFQIMRLNSDLSAAFVGIRTSLGWQW